MASTPSDPPVIPTLLELPRPAPRRRSPLINLALFLATFYTVTLTGACNEAGRAGMEPTDLSAASSPGFLALGLPYSLCLIAILLSHEMGHYLACRRYGLDASLPFFLPNIPVLIGTFGAFIRIRSPFPNRNVLFDVGVAGPLAGFIVALPILAWGVATMQPLPSPGEDGLVETGEPLLMIWLQDLLGPVIPEGYVHIYSGPVMAGWVGCLVTALNLFPIGQLDGGHVCYAVSRSFHRLASWVMLGAFVVLGLLFFQGYLGFAILLVLLGPRHPPVLDEGSELTAGRRLLAAVSLAILLVCFIPRPFVLPRS